MAISLVTSGSGSGNSIDGADITLTLPTLAQNDVVYLTIYGRNRLGGPVPGTSGYTQVGSTVSSGSQTLKVYRKVMMGASPDTQAVITGTGNTADSMEAIYHCLRGVDTTTPEDGVTPTSATGNSTNPDGPSVTTATNNAWVLTAAGSAVNDASITGPSGYSNVVTDTANDTNPSSAGAATKLVATAGAENPAAWTTWSSGAWGAISFSIRADTSVSVALSGIAATTGGGTLGVAATTTAVAGQAATASIGALAPSTDKALTSQVATAAIGAPVPTLAMDAVGLEADTAPGLVGVDLAVPAAGIAATSAQGALSVATGVIVDLVGLGATMSIGAMVAALDTDLSGLPATMSAGMLAISPTLAGLLANGAEGIVVPAVTVPLVGLQLAATPGVLIPDVYQTHRMMLAFG